MKPSLGLKKEIRTRNPEKVGFLRASGCAAWYGGEFRELGIG